MENEAKWYSLHTYSGYENIVEKSIEQLIENSHLQDTILSIKVLTEEQVEEKNGKRKIIVVKVMPCYVFVKIVYSSQLWYMLTNHIRGVTGFVGPQGKAWPLTDDEVKRWHLEARVIDLPLNVGDSVKVTEGPFEGMAGIAKGVDAIRQKVNVTVSMFGRDTDIEMDYSQIELLNK